MNWGQAIADAISLGALYGLVAVGIGLVFGVMRLINFAYGELITAGAYVLAYTSGWPAPLAILMCVAAVVALALAQERIAFRPLRRHGRIACRDARRDVRRQLPAAGDLPARVRHAAARSSARSAS